MNAPRPNDGYERSDAEARPLIVLGLLTIFFLVGGLAVSAWVSRHLTGRLEARAEPSPLESLRVPSDAPRLQPVPARELAELRSRETEVLETAGWVDPVNGIVRIPIERALELTLEEGLPVRESPVRSDGGEGEDR